MSKNFINDLYKANETMAMIGQQTQLLDYLGPNGEALDDFHNVINAHCQYKEYSALSLLADIFLLGLIYGKREERNKRKAKRKTQDIATAELTEENLHATMSYIRSTQEEN